MLLNTTSCQDNVLFLLLHPFMAAGPILQAWRLHPFLVPLVSTRPSTASPPGGTTACCPLPTARSTRRCWCRRWSPSCPTCASSSCGARPSQLVVTGNDQDRTLMETNDMSVQTHVQFNDNYEEIYDNVLLSDGFYSCKFRTRLLSFFSFS